MYKRKCEFIEWERISRIVRAGKQSSQRIKVSIYMYIVHRDELHQNFWRSHEFLPMKPPAANVITLASDLLGSTWTRNVRSTISIGEKSWSKVSPSCHETSSFVNKYIPSLRGNNWYFIGLGEDMKVLTSEN